jgi:hypothetical protein
MYNLWHRCLFHKNGICTVTIRAQGNHFWFLNFYIQWITVLFNADYMSWSKSLGCDLFVWGPFLNKFRTNDLIIFKIEGLEKRYLLLFSPTSTLQTNRPARRKPWQPHKHATGELSVSLSIALSPVLRTSLANGHNYGDIEKDWN